MLLCSYLASTLWELVNLGNFLFLYKPGYFTRFPSCFHPAHSFCICLYIFLFHYLLTLCYIYQITILPHKSYIEFVSFRTLAEWYIYETYTCLLMKQLISARVLGLGLLVSIQSFLRREIGGGASYSQDI